MRRLIDSARLHARLQGPDNERGATAVFVALSLVVLIGFTALVVDVGGMWFERGQLQNGADAAALAVAQNCGKGTCGSPTATAQAFANSNSNDGASNVSAVTVTSSSALVTTTTKDAKTGKGALSFLFAPILGFNGATVQATARASWGIPASGPAIFPVAFSQCQIQNQINGSIQLLQYFGSGANSSCGTNPTVPGGFGWLVQSTDSSGNLLCNAVASAGANAMSNTGNNFPPQCTSLLQQWQAEYTQTGVYSVALLPVFDSSTANGTGGSFHILGFAAFQVMGWKFTGTNNSDLSWNNDGTLFGNNVKCMGSCRGIIGKFIRYVSLSKDFTLGGTSDLGAAVAFLDR